MCFGIAKNKIIKDLNWLEVALVHKSSQSLFSYNFKMKLIKAKTAREINWDQYEFALKFILKIYLLLYLLYARDILCTTGSTQIRTGNMDRWHLARICNYIPINPDMVKNEKLNTAHLCFESANDFATLLLSRPS